MIRNIFQLFILIFVLLVSRPSFADMIQVEEIGSFFINGKLITLSGLPQKEIKLNPSLPSLKVDQNGDYMAYQMYVQYTKLANSKFSLPILMIHGGGVTGVTWETKPDGKPGWEMWFLKSGYTVYVADGVERGRASWARYPEIYKSEPLFRTANDAWALFRVGLKSGYTTDVTKRISFPDSRFPVANFDNLIKETVPRWDINLTETQDAYNQLVRKIGPCVIIAHSQGAYFAFNAALNNPENVRALIAIEPSAVPSASEGNFARLKNVPHLFIFGDNISKSEIWDKWRDEVIKYQNSLVESGVPVDLIDLPKMGIKGNSHFIMMDNNSDDVAKMIQDWLVKKVKIDEIK